MLANANIFNAVGIEFDLDFAEQTAASSPLTTEVDLIQVERTLTGRGQEYGGIKTVFTNPSNCSSINLVYLESLPWFMKPFLHTLETKISFADPSENDRQQYKPIKDVYYRPAVDRHRGTHLELVISVPPLSTLTMTYDFEKAFLRYTEYPPDANRGFDVAPAVIRLLSMPSPTYIRTTSLLLYLPTPDFSMPYNVIILTSTVIALAFGSIFNLLVRRFVGADEASGEQAGGWKRRIRGRIASLRTKLLDKDKRE